MGTTRGTQPGTNGVTLTEAALALGISRDALKKRVQRGAISGYKDESGAWRVMLQAGDTMRAMSRDMGDGTSPGHVSPAVPTSLTAVMDQWLQPLVDRIAEQAEEIGRLRLENEQLHARIEGESRESPAERVTPSEGSQQPIASPGPPQRESDPSQRVRPSWFRRFFLGEG